MRWTEITEAAEASQTVQGATSLLFETFRVMTRDDRGNYLDGTSIMDDVETPKTILKQSAGRSTTPTLVVYPSTDYEPEMQFSLVLEHHHAQVTETFRGEAIPIIKFLISRWPTYGDFAVEGGAATLRDIAQAQRPQLEHQKLWYHGTTSDNLVGIQKMGLTPRDVSQRNYRGINGSETGLVYMIDDEDAARFHAENAAKKFGGAPVVLQIDLTGLERNIVNDHDVRFGALGRGGYDHTDLTVRRILKNPGEASYLSLGTIGYRGRVPASRITVAWQGKERVGRVQKRTDHYQFVNQLGALAKALDQRELPTLFAVLGVPPSGLDGGRAWFGKEWSSDPEKTVNTIYQRKSAPNAFVTWVNGMRRRCSTWRKRLSYGLSDHNVAAIVSLIDQEHAKLTEITEAAAVTSCANTYDC